MSVYGTNPQYIIGAMRQVELCKTLMPGWRVRIYTDNAISFHSIRDQIDVIEVTDGSFGMFWRFRPMWESSDNIVVVRDSDSRVTIREAKAVNEWLDSNYNFHVIKDHPAHYDWPINGGLFGYRGQLTNELWNSLMYYQHQGHHYTLDQVWLRDCMWPVVASTACMHSMNSPGWFSQTRDQLRNKLDFCGNGYTENDLPIYPCDVDPNWDPKSVTEADKFDMGNML